MVEYWKTWPRSDADGRSALIVVDLDGFKPVNDSHGHEAGDILLAETGCRLRSITRRNDLVARMGGDEFVVTLNDIHDREDVLHFVERVSVELARPVNLPTGQVSISASMGIAISPDDHDNGADLYNLADLALFDAKRCGKATARLFEAGMKDNLRRRKAIEDRLRVAVADDAFELRFQPQIRLSDGALTGVEVLLRWTDAELGSVSPGEFIPVAEETGQIRDIDEWVLSKAMDTASRWTGQLADIRVAINLSAMQFARPDLGQTIGDMIDKSGIDPARLELEITETAILRPDTNTIGQLETLRSKGVRIAIDDFGVGYSSLSYLKKLPLDQVKLDRSFVGDIEDDLNDRAIIDAICNMARALELEVVAEGIETRIQLEFLRNNFCHRGQGFLISRPLDEAALKTFRFECDLELYLSRPAQLVETV
jgi:diguanylate cyclase (GGDEF)-like protein